ncbi:MAG: hypothetical protein D6771_02010 [Zetaproteobacteria bacterium]|nr:MAG: hypothetical protein D6771_02010 [Zetaproteobacteria bacterium]
MLRPAEGGVNSGGHQRSICVFDIETVPDPEAARRLLRDESLETHAAGEALRGYFAEITGGRNDFPRQPFHRVVAISYAWLRREPAEEGGWEPVLLGIGSIGTPEDDERALLEAFFGAIAERRPQLVTYNGRGFDLPVLKLRAMAHRLSCPEWFTTGDRWQNYDARYDSRYHLDLAEVLSDFGAAARCRLDEIAAAFGVPGKLGVEGGDVEKMFLNGEIEAIRAYCETDVCTTLLVALRWWRFTGEVGEGAYQRAEAGLRNYLAQEAETQPHLGAFLARWEELER